MEIVSPSGRVYQWDKSSPPTAEDMAALQEFDAKQGPSPVAAAPLKDENILKKMARGAGMVPRGGGAPGSGLNHPALGIQSAANMNAVGRAAQAGGLEGAGGAGGQVIGASLGPMAPVGIPALGGILGGAGYVLDRLRQGQAPTMGGATGAVISNAIPGEPLAGAAAKTLIKAGAKQGVGNLAATAAESGIDRGALPTGLSAAASTIGGAGGVAAGRLLDRGTRQALAAQLKAKNTIRDEILLPGIEAGYVLSGTALDKRNPGKLNSALESIGAKAATNAEASIINQEVTDDLIRKRFNIPPGPLRRSEPAMKIKGTFEQVRDQYAKPYQEITGISNQAKADLETLDTKNRLTATNAHEYGILTSDPKMVKQRAELALKAGADVQELKRLRFEGHDKIDAAFRDKGNPELLKEGRAMLASAEELEDKIAEMATKIGRPQLAEQLKVARKMISQSHYAENALGHDGRISAPVLGRMLDNNAPLTDELRTIAKFEQKFGRIMQEEAKAPAPTTNYAKFATAGMFAAPGAALGNYPLAAAGAVAPFMAPYLARQAMFSEPYQRAFLRPNYKAPLADPLASFARQSIAAAARQPNPLMTFLEQQYPRKQGAPTDNQFLRSMPSSPVGRPQARPTPAIEVAAVPVPEPMAPLPEPEPVAVAAAPQAPQFIEGQIYRDPQTGIRKRYMQGQWVDL